MATLILTQREVRDLLDMRECIERMEEALTALARGRAQNPLRWPMFLPDDSSGSNDDRRILGMMPGSLEDPPAVGLKVVTVSPGNHGTPHDTHQGVVLLFEPEHGRPAAILDGSEVTAIRTAAVSALATRLLAREDAHVLAILGSGVQARTHLEAMRAVRDVTRARVHSPTRASREAFAARESERHGIPVEAVDSARAAVEGADLVCTTTSSREPILEGAWLAPGTHVNAVGACTPNARELDTAAVARARVYVDGRESAANEAGDLLIPQREGAIGADHVVGELGELLVGAVPGRVSPEDVTLFESLGLAVEDLAAALHVVDRARAAGVGTTVVLGGLRDGAAG